MNPKQHRAVTSATSWLSSAGAEVTVEKDSIKARGPAGSVSIPSDSLDLRILESPEMAVKFLSGVASEIGVSIKASRDSATSTRALSFTDAAIRHQEFRRVPNPNRAELERYLKIVAPVVRTSFTQSESTWRAAGLLEEDLISYASVWTVTFLGLYERKDKKSSDNRHVFVRYLRQRLGNLRESMTAKRNAPVTVEAAMVGQGFGYVPEMFVSSDIPDLRIEEECDKGEPLSRRQAKAKLQTALKAMGTNMATAKLLGLKNHSDPEVAELAAKILSETLN